MQWTTKGMTVMFHVKALWSHLNSSRQLWTHFVPILGCFCHGFVMTSHSSSYQTRPLTSSFPELPLALRPTAGAAHRQHKRRPGTQHAHTSVGRKQLTRLLRHSAVLLFITCLTPDAFLFVASAHFRPLRSCCIHSNFFYRLTMNHFFVWIFFSYLAPFTLYRPCVCLFCAYAPGLSALCTSCVIPLGNNQRKRCWWER